MSTNLLQYLIGPGFALALAIVGVALYSRMRDAARDEKKSSDEDEARVRSHLLADEERTRKLMQDELERWEGGFMRRLNGTYLRGPEAKLRFEGIEKAMERVEQHLAQETDMYRDLIQVLQKHTPFQCPDGCPLNAKS